MKSINDRIVNGLALQYVKKKKNPQHEIIIVNNAAGKTLEKWKHTVIIKFNF